MENKSTWKKTTRPESIATCCILMIFLNKTYDEIESYCKVNSELHHLLGTSKLPGHSVIHRGMKKLPTSYLRWTIARMIFKQALRTYSSGRWGWHRVLTLLQ